MTVYVIVQLKMTDRAAYDRYQARLAWLAPFALALAALGQRNRPGLSGCPGFS